MKVLLAMSGGVDSSAAALVLQRQGHEVTGVTMRLWGGESDTGCCSVSDVDDARRVAQQLDIDHLVFNFSEEFNEHVVTPYVDAHVQGITPNPCIECNRHLKFDRLIERGRLLGFDAVATGHHARIESDQHGLLRVVRGEDAKKDQSYVVHMLSGDDLSYVLFPVGNMEKSQVREIAQEAGLRTASKPDSQDVCFIGSTVGREGFLGDRTTFRPADVVDTQGQHVGTVQAVELVTIGQRRGLNLGGGDKRYVVDVDVAAQKVVVGPEEDLFVDHMRVADVVWPHGSDADSVVDTNVLVQGSAHGARASATLRRDMSDATLRRDMSEYVVHWHRPQRRIAPGQSVVFYDSTDTYVLGGGLAR
jgi:tRNA-uridine 2-sulfurtransferase